MTTQSQTGETYKAGVLIVDDHPLVRHGLTQLINAQPDLVVWGEAENGREAVEAIAALRPDVAVIDISLTGDADGIEVITDIKARFSKLPVLVLSMHNESVFVERALRAGARGYVTKEEAMETLLTAIRCVLVGKVWVSEELTRKMLSGFVVGSVDTNDSV